MILYCEGNSLTNILNAMREIYRDKTEEDRRYSLLA